MELSQKDRKLAKEYSAIKLLYIAIQFILIQTVPCALRCSPAAKS